MPFGAHLSPPLALLELSNRGDLISDKQCKDSVA